MKNKENIELLLNCIAFSDNSLVQKLLLMFDIYQVYKNNNIDFNIKKETLFSRNNIVERHISNCDYLVFIEIDKIRYSDKFLNLDSKLT